ncbi:MAG TPA: Crp/Fnr family transcriptional regulator [Cellvibrio sp.]|nr:Crp/Fnr family transcriptional regulator [Cellvibrio sp.]
MLPTPDSNELLRALPPKSQQRLFPSLELCSLPSGIALHESGGTLDNVYFPVNCIISLIYVMESGASTGILVIGNEGMIGTPLFMGGESTPSRAVVQNGGFAYRISARRFKDEFNLHTDLLLLLLRYTQSLITQVAQTAACNRHHSIDQQLCRWLLLSLDRLSDNRITMTQESISYVLGVRREGITEAAGKLQRLGVIEYARGRITVVNRSHLEQLSCECYAVVKKETDRLMRPPTFKQTERLFNM